ncbi:MAG: bifunctional diaminohydroxyphosphoribosylaminopyrimidine deaminase/5-amino-6-(5-phosphoribosylamino)uracil reductase RibD [Dehalococcoidia bacterium]|nr:bifunctional diaminohydroxyphosphoribosylaminopyrimidine deaminase/5-amino-6-(5-phosphoribosylamino)uracil reductase RibD [Dehalococcoidia bacterium]
MARALELARANVARTSPNPWVGAVVVRDGRVVGEGFHEGPGTPHAEVAALEQAGELAKGADVYVSLEPCAVSGRTGPCTDALIEAGVTRVFYAMDDPDPRTEGRARAILTAAGIHVEAGLHEAEARELLEPYSHQRKTSRPFVTAKFAVSLDGKIAATSGDSRWVSSDESRVAAHERRSRVDGIVVGSETVVVDNPQLTARPNGKLSAHQPLRVVLDGRGRISTAAAVFAGRGRPLVITSDASSQEWRSEISMVSDVEVVSAGSNGGVDPAAALNVLNARGALHVLVEGGGRLHGSFFDAGLVDKVYAVIAPLIIGGEGRGAVVGAGAATMSAAWRLDRVSVNKCGPDIIVEGYPRRGQLTSED